MVRGTSVILGIAGRGVTRSLLWETSRLLKYRVGFRDIGEGKSLPYTLVTVP